MSDEGGCDASAKVTAFGQLFWSKLIVHATTSTDRSGRGGCCFSQPDCNGAASDTVVVVAAVAALAATRLRIQIYERGNLGQARVRHRHVIACLPFAGRRQLEMMNAIHIQPPSHLANNSAISTDLPSFLDSLLSS